MIKLTIWAISLISLSFLQPTSAQIPTSPPSTTLTPAPISSVGQKPNSEIVRLYNEAASDVQKKNYQGALDKINQAEKVGPLDSDAYNLLGAIYTHQKEYPKAIEAFDKAADLNKKAFAPRFNLSEVFFLSKMYPEAEAHFQSLLAENAKNELVLYKVYLCKLMLGKDAEAKGILDKLNFGDDLPTYYYAHAAWEFKNNNQKEGRGWVTSAANIYSPSANALFSDSLVELGWLPRDQSKQ